MGTIAWLTATDSVTNSFTAGNITNPYKPEDPKIDPEDPGNTDSTDQLDGNLYEMVNDKKFNGKFKAIVEKIV